MVRQIPKAMLRAGRGPPESLQVSTELVRQRSSPRQTSVCFYLALQGPASGLARPILHPHACSPLGFLEN